MRRKHAAFVRIKKSIVLNAKTPHKPDFGKCGAFWVLDIKPLYYSSFSAVSGMYSRMSPI